MTKTIVGFRLNTSDRDKVVAGWIDEKERAGANVSEAIKDLIYQAATSGDKQEQILRALASIRQLVEAGVYIRADNGEPASEDEVFNALDSFVT